jgi:hypothetical protein
VEKEWVTALFGGVGVKAGPFRQHLIQRNGLFADGVLVYPYTLTAGGGPCRQKRFNGAGWAVAASARESGRQFECPYGVADTASALSAGNVLPI